MDIFGSNSSEKEINYSDYTFQTSPPPATTGSLRIYSKSDNNFYKQDSLGNESVIGGGGGNPFDQDLNTTDSPTFNNLTLNGTITGSDIAQATQLTALNAGGALFTTVQDLQNIFHSAGYTAGGGITNNGNGTIAIADGQGFLRNAGNELAPCYFIAWPFTASLALTDNALNYIGITWNSGSPIPVASITPFNDYNTFTLATVYRAGTTLHITGQANNKVADHASNMINRNKALMYIARESGANVSETGTRNFSISEGVFWIALNRFSVPAFNSATGGTFRYYYNSASYITITGQTQIDNNQYDNAGTLTALNNNQYGVHWVYLGADSDVYVIYGTQSYTLTDAQNASPPSVTPPHFEKHAILIAKITILKGESTFTSIRSAFTNSFTTGAQAVNIVNGTGTDNAIARFDTNGNTLQNSNVLITDTGHITGIQGTAAAPAYSFTSDPDTGIYQSGVGGLQIATDGVQRVLFNFEGIQNGVLGSASVASYTFIGDKNTGMYSSAADNIDFTTGGTRRVNISVTGIQLLQGSAGACAYSFIGDSNTGIYSPAAESMSFATNGVERLNINGGGIRCGTVNNNASSPAFTWINDSDTGMFSNISDTLQFSAGGLERVRINSTGLLPSADNTYALGGLSNRWTQLFAATSVIETSDATQKIVNGDSFGLDIITKLRPVKYKWIDTQDILDEEGNIIQVGKKHTRNHLGFLAQDIETLINNNQIEDSGVFVKGAIIEDEKGANIEVNIKNIKTDDKVKKFIYGLRYSELIAPLVKAVQELNDKIKILTEKINLLEAR